MNVIKHEATNVANNAKYVSLVSFNGKESVPLDCLYDRQVIENTLEYKPYFGCQVGYVLDETNIPIPDIPKFRPTAKRVYLDSPAIPRHTSDLLSYDWLGINYPSHKWAMSWINEWMLKGECYVLDEQFLSA